MSPPTPTAPPLSPSHPLIAELSALRNQLAQYQKQAHQSSIQLQGARLELALAKDQNAGLISAVESLKSEVNVLRSNPSPPSVPPQSTALSELSLAHRRLSAKLDLTESALESAQLELAATQHELARLAKDRESDRATINELRREKDEWDEELAWEQGERRNVEEQKKLVDLALKEYATLVHSLDPNAVPPELPTRSPSNILNATPSLTSDAKPATPQPESPASAPASTSAESISNLLVGQRGVHRLFEDFTSTLASREAEIRKLQAKVDAAEQSLSLVEEQLESERTLRVQCVEERDRVVRDDQSAAKVVERYMTFTQKAHATVHLHLDNLRIRSGATQATLRKEAVRLQKQLEGEVDRARKVREAVDELSEGLARESAGRRREVALRLKMVAEEEVRERRVEKWLDKVRRARAGAEGAVIEPDSLQTLLDEGVSAIAPNETTQETPSSRFRLFRKKSKQQLEPARGDDGEEASIARVLLAEELVNTLVADLQEETERRAELERQRVDWLAREAVEGVPAHDGDDGGLVFDVEHEEHEEHGANGRASIKGVEQSQPESTQPEPARLDSPAVLDLPTPSPSPNNSTLHSLTHSLASLRSSVPVAPPTPNTPLPSASGKRNPTFLSLSRRPPLADPVLLALLDGLHEVIEDARVDVEIARSDEERVYRGFEALLNVGKAGAVRGQDVLADATEYLSDRIDGDGWRRLEKRVEDVEHDVMSLQRAVHELAGELDKDDPDEYSGGSVWEGLGLKTVSPAQTRATSPNPLTSPLGNPLDGARRAGAGTVAMIGNVGRSFSASVIGAPRKEELGGGRGEDLLKEEDDVE
ncbi:hypothetical protein EHS25_004946 [Saitozyma podzolica]|uniref:Uncharacterized protein n=1 Tax=Saitozyma podzolica TaxID=1890683 RepID=A0A427Y233_9TREE|nr:hypothetical protein EHS25_004946 [Saitozyma podzolica]